MAFLPFTFHNATSRRAAVLLSVPHAGRDYSQYAHLLRVPIGKVQSLEDRHADRLADAAIAAGTPALIAHAPRLAIDLNRGNEDFDPAMVRGGAAAHTPLTAKARGGLGLIPSKIVEAGSIWQSPLDAADVEARRRKIYDPWHAATAQWLAAAHAIHGGAILIDLHSMPGISGADAPDIVIGDRFGLTASASVAEAAVAHFAGAGFRVANNIPYAGGHIITRHADPRANVHALQVEVDRRLYLDDALDHPGEGLLCMQAVVASLIAALSCELSGTFAAAAE